MRVAYARLGVEQGVNMCLSIRCFPFHVLHETRRFFMDFVLKEIRAVEWQIADLKIPKPVGAWSRSLSRCGESREKAFILGSLKSRQTLKER